VPEDLGNRSDERPFGAADRRSEERRAQGDEPDDRDGQRVFRPDERADPDHVAVATGVLKILLDQEADRDDGEEGEPRARHASHVARPPGSHPTSAERRRPSLQSQDADRDGKGRPNADDGERNAHGSPVVVSRVAQGTDERLAWAELGEEDGVVAHEQGDARKRPERDPCPHHPG